MLNNVSQFKIGVVQMVTAMCIAGTIGLFVVNSNASPYEIAFFRCLLGAIGLLVACSFMKVLNFRNIPLKNYIYIAIGGACLVYNWVFLFKSYQHISLSVGTVIYHIKPFVILIIGAFLFQERLSKHTVAWTIIAFFGTTLIVDLYNNNLSFSYEKSLGIFYAFVAALMYSISTLIVKYVSSVPGILIALMQVSLGVVLLAPFISLSEISFSGNSWIYILLLGFFNTSVMYSLSYSAYQKLPAYSIAILSFIYPIVTILTDYVFFDYHFNLAQGIGALIIMLATLGVNLHWKILPTFGWLKNAA